MMKTIFALMFQGVIPCLVGLGGSKFAPLAAANTTAAQGAAGTFGANAANEGADINPFYGQEMRAEHLFDPTQTNELLTNTESGAGAATGAEQSALINNATRTGNATGVTKSLDEMARDKSKAAAGASEGIAAQDVMGAKALNQQGAAGMQGLYGVNTGAQLGAMKQANADIQTQQELNPGWLKGVEGIVNTASNAASAAAKF